MTRALVVACVVVSASACSTLVDVDPGVALYCVDDVCPTESHVACVVEGFARVFDGDLDPRAPLRVTWQSRPIVECMAEGALACSPDEAHVIASSDALLVHELHHVMLWRATGDPDREHGTDEWDDDEARAKLAPKGCE